MQLQSVSQCMQTCAAAAIAAAAAAAAAPLLCLLRMCSAISVRCLERLAGSGLPLSISCVAEAVNSSEQPALLQDVACLLLT